MLSLEHQELSNQQNKGYLPEDMWSKNSTNGCQANEYSPDQEPRTCFTTVDALMGIGFLSENLGRREQMRMAALLQTKGFLKDEQQKTINGVRGYYCTKRTDWRS